MFRLLGRNRSYELSSSGTTVQQGPSGASEARLAPAMGLTRALSFNRRRGSAAGPALKEQPRTPSPSASSRDLSDVDSGAGEAPSTAISALSGMLYKKHKKRFGWDKRYFDVHDELGVLFYFGSYADKVHVASSPQSMRYVPHSQVVLQGAGRERALPFTQGVTLRGYYSRAL